MRRRLAHHLALIVTTLALPSHAHGPDVETAALRWVRGDGAESCPAEADVAHSIEQRLGRPAFVPAERAELVVEAKLSALPDGRFRTEITLLRGDQSVGRRELESEGPSCQILAENAALVIALTIDPEASLDPLPIEAAPVEAPKPPPAPTPAPAAPPERTPPAAPVSRDPWQADLEVAGGVATGIVPEVAAGVFARGRVLPPGLPLAVELQGAYFPARSVEAVPGRGASFTEFFGGAALCSRPSRANRWRGSLCAGADVGAVTGQGHGYGVTPQFRTLTVALSARGRLGLRVLPGLAVVAGPDFAVPLKRDYFEAQTANGTEQLFRMSPVGFGFELGAVWEL